MSSPTDNDLNLDLHFLPAWAKQPSNRNLYAEFEGESEGRGGRGRGDRPFHRREGPSRDRQGPRPEGDRRPRPFQARREDRGPGRLPRGAPPPREARPINLEPLPEIKLTFRPDEKGVDSLARQIRMSGRAYPVFGVALMILARPERHSVTFAVTKGPDGQVLQPLYLCALDDTLWLSEQEAVDYVLNQHFNTFYQAEKTAIEPPKGTYTFVAQCGLSGTILGPPNHHDYQNQLRKLHADRFARMPFEVYKSRVKIVRDEAVIKKWLDSQSFKTDYVCLNMPEPLRLGSMEEVEKHFRENHSSVIIKQVDSHTLSGATCRALRCGPLVRLLRAAWEDQKRFPLQTSTVLSQQFAARSLQFFKVNKNVTHVAVARPHYLDLDSTPVSNGIRQIVTFINEHPRCTRRQLIDALAPAPVIPVAAPAPAPAALETPAQGEPAPGAVTATPPAQAVSPPPSPEASPEATMIISDLHWLIHQGHVIEFADGRLETAKKPVVRPSKSPAQPAQETAPGSPPSAAELATDAPPEPPVQSVPAASAEAPIEAPSAEPVPAATAPEAPQPEPAPVSEPPLPASP